QRKTPGTFRIGQAHGCQHHVWRNREKRGFCEAESAEKPWSARMARPGHGPGIERRKEFHISLWKVYTVQPKRSCGLKASFRNRRIVAIVPAAVQLVSRRQMVQPQVRMLPGESALRLAYIPWRF